MKDDKEPYMPDKVMTTKYRYITGTSPRRKERHHGSDEALDVGSAGSDLT